jgi:DNA excision repair protein ERCC-5
MIGIPYVKATSEAESQCARFEIEGLVDGVITEDSDVFLFGARNVFRGVFNDNIKYFSAHKIL